MPAPYYTRYRSGDALGQLQNRIDGADDPQRLSLPQTFRTTQLIPGRLAIEQRVTRRDSRLIEQHSRRQAAALRSRSGYLRKKQRELLRMRPCPLRDWQLATLHRDLVDIGESVPL